ncbi:MULTISPECIES: nucleotide kinase domain-containing protein [Polaromonas]|uniref:Nucleotide kinase domain-containing protein n=1 Tax=Polaromonas aquatica TaxID=332657 RepID=A0ABW1TZ62_9BURK
MKNDILASELEHMVQWITEREAIRKRKEQGLPKPWTENRFLRDFRWCNVRRMDDRVSVALMANWYPLQGKPETQLVAAVLARLVNWPASLDDITGPQRFDISHLERARAKLAYRATMGWKVFTGAYVVPGVPGRNKVDSVCDLADLVASQASSILADSMAGTWAKLIKIDGLGSFLAGQIVADLAHLSAGQQWHDASTWAPLGPGSARGMNRLMGRPKDKAISQDQFNAELPALMEVLKPLIRDIYLDRNLHGFDFQNDLCEYDKFRRLMLGEGQVRSRYEGSGDAQIGLL